MSPVFGKRPNGSLNGRRASQVVPEATRNPEDVLRGKLDYILANMVGDERPYLQCKIFGVEFLGLLDSGASRTILGGLGFEKFKEFGLKLHPNEVKSCGVADGTECPVIGSFIVPFCVEDRVACVEVLVMPSLPHMLILGADFWRKLGIVPDLRHAHWKFSASPDVTLCSLTDGSHLTSEQSRELDDFLQGVFSDMPEDLGCTTLVQHVIKTTADPIKQRFYPISPALQRHVYAELDDMLEKEIVESSTSPWSSPIVMVRKPDGQYRFCVDYRKLNKVTERDAYPLPFISNTLDKLRDARYLSSLDIKSAYWQVPMSPECKAFTAFTVPGRGLFQFRRMPFGLHNAPATWQRLIDRVLSHMEQYVFVYLDDIVVVTQTFERHLEVLREVFFRLREAGLTVRRDKCHFCRPELKFLGYVVNASGLHCDPDKVAAILNIPSPTNVKEVRRFIGVTSWYRRFVANCSGLLAPISRLLRKGSRFKWTEECETAFKTIKERLASAPVMSCPDFERPFVIQTDASDFGLGAVLSQNFPEGERVVSFISRSLTSSERKFSTTEKECLAVLWAIEKFRPYIEATHFTIVTDHFALLWLNNLKDPSGRLARWCVKLQQYDFDIVHRRGKENVVPDALSRSVPAVDELSVTTPLFQDFRDDWYRRMLANISNKPLDYPLWRVNNGAIYRRTRSLYPGLEQGGFEWKIVVPKSHRRDLIRENHDTPTAGHAGTHRTYCRLLQKYYWPKMKADVASYVRTCRTCLAHKPEQKAPAGLMSGRPDVKKPWELLSVDLVGPLPKSSSGYMYILSVQDYFSKFCVFIPLRTPTAKAIVRQLEDRIFLVFGVPRVLLTDNGKVFVGREMKQLASTYEVQLKHTAYYHPQANACERQHRTLKVMLSSFVKDKQRDWDVLLPKVACAMRTSRSESTGLTPYFINFGREMVLRGPDHVPPLNQQQEGSEPLPPPEERASILEKVFRDVRKRLDQAQARSQKNYNLRRRDVRYEIGDRVWRREHALSNAANYFTAKLGAKFSGPYTISKRVSPWTYHLRDINGQDKGIWNVKDLKPDPGEIE